MTQVSHSPGVPSNLPTVVASSVTPVLSGPPLSVNTTGIIGTGVIATNHTFYWVSSTGANNVWPEVLTRQGVVVPYSSSTPIVLPTQVGLFPNL